MMVTKRIAHILLTAFLILGVLLLASCGGGKDTDITDMDDVNTDNDNGNEQTSGDLKGNIYETVKKDGNEYIVFGSYDQDGNFSNGNESIEWLVLDRQDDKMLVISRYGLMCQSYGFDEGEVTWENSFIRELLNIEFFGIAFEDTDAQRVITVPIDKEANPYHGTEAGYETQDKIFLLSISEAEKYLKGDSALCYPTQFAINNGAWVDDNTGASWWWLRSPGYSSEYVATVSSDGRIDYDGVHPFYGVEEHYDAASMYGNVLVRPAMWLSLNENVDVEPVAPGTEVEQPVTAPEQDKIVEEDGREYIVMGKYEQDGDFDNGKEPIEWLIVHKQDDKMLVISRYALNSVSFTDKQFATASWSSSNIRKWLFYNFYDIAFTNSEKNSITEDTKTTDKMFLLSINEIYEYFEYESDRVCRPTEYAKNNGSWVNSEGYCMWWLRTQGEEPYLVSHIESDGDISFYGAEGSGGSVSVRPAMWITLN